jgi:hypothetical protein
MALRRSATAAATALLLALALTACVPEPDAAGPSPTASQTAAATRTPAPTPTAEAARVPTDCRAMLTPAVLDQLAAVPLNDPALGASGVQGDGSLVCVWGASSASVLRTTISMMSRGPALDMLNGLLAEGYACYTPDGGTRCEKTWFSEPDLIPEGRTLFWRDDVLIDSSFTNLAPSGYTAAIVGSVFG